ncbi:hypothetical protein KIN20_008980 [Parelaphostrongylus tenuis]|uniref:Uncharacterized protein n=1 Tax=Parelaphostrongylus tenuis TaxID=148309 RepID=A0AAD5M5K9_PARTN|nr:hypothetical protein KIN20_008980 [Parelaphostrongylus tenuis]
MTTAFNLPDLDISPIRAEGENENDVDGRREQQVISRRNPSVPSPADAFSERGHGNTMEAIRWMCYRGPTHFLPNMATGLCIVK